MTLDKAIKSGKEHRKLYRDSKAIDSTCRNHGSCPWCSENRQHKFRDKQVDELKEWKKQKPVNIKYFECPLCGDMFPIWEGTKLDGIKGLVCKECLLTEHPEYAEDEW